VIAEVTVTSARYRNEGGNRKSAMFASSWTPALLIAIDVAR